MSVQMTVEQFERAASESQESRFKFVAFASDLGVFAADRVTVLNENGDVAWDFGLNNVLVDADGDAFQTSYGYKQWSLDVFND